MIQELLGGNNAGIITKGDQKPKLSNNDSSSPSSPSSSAAAENLRCPRCDSSNTKFCYYNNYNLTQPRHFCKTCRRYWTKGGALRNVPIGGGCRKNKTSAVSPAVGKSLGKLKSHSSDVVRTGLFSGFEHAHDHPHPHHHHHQPHLSANPNLLWASSQQNNYNFLSLLRANQNPNHHHHQQQHLQNQNPISVKQESNNNSFLFGSSSSPSSSSMTRVTGLDTLGPAHISSSGLSSSSSVYRNQVPGPPGFMHGDVQNNGLQELYQRLRSPSTSCYFPENAPLILGNIASANPTAVSSAILDSAPVGTGELGFWNANLSWPTHDLPTTNSGAYQS